MNIFRNLITGFADDILIKIMEYKEFPEEKYEIVIENKKLREQILTSQSKQYNKLLEENESMRKEINKLKDDKIRRLEFENQMLKLELSKSGSSNLLIGTQEDGIDPLEISKFVYTNGLFKYHNDNGKSGTKVMKEIEFLDIVNKIFPDGKLNILGNELHISLYKSKKFIGNLILDLNTYNRVSEIDDWIESKLDKYNKSYKEVRYYDFIEE